MSKKLLTGVLSMGVLLMFSAMAFAGLPSNLPNGKTAEYAAPVGENTAAPLFGMDDPQTLGPDLTGLTRLDLTTSSQPILMTETHALPDFVCHDEDLTQYGTGFNLFPGPGFFHDGADYGGVFVTGWGTVINIPSSDQGYLCSLDGTWSYLYDITGDLDIEYSIYTAVAGVPGALLASQIISTNDVNVRLRDGTGFTFIDWSSYGIYVTGDFIVSLEIVNGSGSNPGVDELYILIDNFDGTATVGRDGITKFEGTWYRNEDLWGGPEFRAIISAVICCEEIPFTDCTFRTDFDIGCYAFVFSVPNGGNCRSGLAKKYRSQGYDTLVTARFGMTDFGAGPEPGAAYLIEILGDDGTGVADPANVLFSTILGGAGNELDILPFGLAAFAYVDVPIGIVIPPSTDYHLAIRWAGPIPHDGAFQLYLGADDFTAGCNVAEGASVFWSGTYGTIDVTCGDGANFGLDGWYSYTSTFGYNPDHWIEALVCRDKYVNCELVASYANIAFIVPWGDGEGALGHASSYPAGGDECRIESYTVGMHAWENLDSINFCIFADASGEPGAVLYTESLDGASIPPPTNFDTYCGPNSPSGSTWFHTVYPNGGAGLTFSGAYWIGAIVYTDGLGDFCTSYWWHLISNGSAAMPRSGLLLDPVLWGVSYAPLTAIYGGDYNSITEAYQCCVPFNEVVCVPSPDWPTYQHDYARTGHSTEALGAADCNLNALWTETSDARNSFSGSVIYGNTVLISDDGGYDARDLGTGALIWDQATDATVAGLFLGCQGNKTQPTVADIGGTLTAFLGSAFLRDMVAVDAATGAYLWHATGGGLPFPGLQPKIDNAKSVVWNDGAIDVLFYTGESSLFAVEAATGLPYAGWGTNPLDLSAAGDNLNAVSTDGTQLFVPTYSGAVPGNLFAIDAATGAINWDLATVAGDPGLNAGVEALDNYDGNEGFWSGASYDDDEGVIWANSYLNADHPAEGFLYRIAANGSGYTAAASTRSRRATPTIDRNAIYVPVFTRWLGPAYDGFGIYDRNTGGFIAGLDGAIGGDRQYNDGVLSCEPGADDWWILGTELGHLNFFQMGNLNSWSFDRVTTLSGFDGGQWAGGSMTTDALVFTNFNGTTVRFGAGVDRARLSIINVTSSIAVPFGTAVGTPFPFTDIFTNLGCVDLVVDSITLDDTPAPVASNTEIEFTSVSPSLLAKMREYADNNTNSWQFEKIALMLGERDNGITGDDLTAVSSSTLNYRAAAAFPAVVDGASGFNGVASPAPGDAVAAGDVVDIVIHANGPAVTRGPHAFFASLYTNDPDYYLDDFTKAAEVQLIFVGGCVEDSTVINFGVGGTNFTVVWNTANMAYFTSDGDHSININGYEAGGSQGVPFGALRGYFVSGRRMAMTGQSWDGAGDNYFSILGDPNYCSNDCKPNLASDVLLGEISTDMGATYTQVFGDVAAATYIDSVRDYSDGFGGWDTRVLPLSFDNDSTMGFIANETHYGAKDVVELADFKLVRIDVTNRSATDSINDLVHYAHHDYDLGGGSNNTMIGRPDKGYIYASGPSLTISDGYVKVPFGCGAGSDFNYGINALACDQGLSWWSFESNAHWDLMNDIGQGNQGLNTIIYQVNMNTFAGEPGAASDASGDWFFGSMDLGPSETKSFGIAQFAFTNMTDASDADQYIGFADLINKWAGWGRGDVNNDQVIDMADVIYLAGSVAGGNGPYPFRHLGNVDGAGDPDVADAADVAYLVDYYFGCGACPVGDWYLGLCAN
ncbi:PQQ-binding-like beta-propeller repeat protein [Gemmatimonas aurantiaca]|nr:PQQ-binding-like beta-propeller repeat protein [Gemmatimonas aurantiaca]